MSQILDSLPAARADRILCCYANDDRKIKIARITNVPNWYFERVVFPGERLLFESLPKAQLEIYMMRSSTVDLVEFIACDRLAVKNSQNDRDRISQWREDYVDESGESPNVRETMEDLSSQTVKGLQAARD